MKFTFNPLFSDATNEQKWEQIRLWRNAELVSTDWTQLADSTADKATWAAYRQELRDLPSKFVNADDVELPIKP